MLLRRLESTADVAYELEQIRLANGGLVLASKVVEFARDPATALHKHFEWDDTKAAAGFRLQQARHVIRCHVTVISQETAPVRAFVSLSPDRRTGGGYRSIGEVLANATLTQTMLADALIELQAIRAKYQNLKQLRPVWEAIATLEGDEDVAAQAAG